MRSFDVILGVFLWVCRAALVPVAVMDENYLLLLAAGACAVGDYVLFFVVG